MDPSVSNNYSLNNDATFTIDDSYTLFGFRIQSGVVGAQYTVGALGIDFFWQDVSGFYSQFIDYVTYPTIGVFKTAVASLTGLDTSSGFFVAGDSVYDSSASACFKLNPYSSISPDASVYPGLRDCTVGYYTISDQLLLDRSSYVLARDSTLGNRISALTSRQASIMANIDTEAILRDTDGNTGDLYAWSDLRFNRRQGCDAKLKQIEAQIASNKSASNTNQRILS